MSKDSFDHTSIEPKWQAKWEEDNTYSPDVESAKKPYFNLMMFPYPSAEGMHVGNMYAFTGADIHGRFMRMNGHDVLEPIGLDGFGIHSENYSLKVGTHPMDQAEKSERNFYRQFHLTGNSFDWNRTVETYNPSYYRWTQWLFTQMFKAGLAYRKKATVNYCPSCKTVLADEQVIKGLCERCSSTVEKKALEQWFFRITDYAEKLLSNIEQLDWTEKVKIAQRNWIGKSSGAKIKFKLKLDSSSQDAILEVFTTRPDTLYGATFLVISPEHPYIDEYILKNNKLSPKVQNDIKSYTKASTAKKEEDRIAEGKEKTGVFSGLMAINPINGQEIPVWIADYVLMSYGTGAIMAVPAHDARDLAFARTYDLPVKQVIMPETGISRADEERRDGGCAIVFDPQTQKYAVAQRENGDLALFAGGVADGEDITDGILRELTEESGLYNFKDVQIIKTMYAHYSNRLRNVSRVAKATCLLVILENADTQQTHLEEHEKFSLVWKSADEIRNSLEGRNSDKGVDHWLIFLSNAVGRAIQMGLDRTSDPLKYREEAYVGKGTLINSDVWDGLQVPEAMPAVIADIEKRTIGNSESTYHLRDWLISRQRYWGAPIPMIFCKACAQAGKSYFTKTLDTKLNNHLQEWDSAGWFPVSDDELPVMLPRIEDYKPLGTGKAPLASHPEFYEVKCPDCGQDAQRETDVSDTFLDSAWYFFRYPSTDIEDKAFDIERTKEWLPVNMYIGGAEHSVLHLLYSRFVTMVLADLKLINFEEPFKRFFAHGLLVKEGAKMSKSKGNVIVPDEYIAKYGADTLRSYLMFLGPFSQGGDFYDTGIEGMNRFLKRVWRLFENTQVLKEESATDANALRMLHKTIRRVTDDVSRLQYNTALAGLMEYYNFLSEQKEVSREEAVTFLKLLAPFAPHMTEELYQKIKGFAKYESIHTSAWPVSDPNFIVEEEVVIAIQVNGKLRGTIHVEPTMSEDQAAIQKQAEQEENTTRYLTGKTIKKVIYVPGKLINFVVV